MAQALRLEFPFARGTSLQLATTAIVANLVGLVLAWTFVPYDGASTEAIAQRAVPTILIWLFVQIAAVSFIASARIRRADGSRISFASSCAVGIIFALSNMLALFLVALVILQAAMVLMS